jgi:hypothetical protein
VAYPADYRSSGVNTFVVGTDGVLYEKDLGKKTETMREGASPGGDRAESMKELNPDSSWQKSQEVPQQAAGEPPNN